MRTSESGKKIQIFVGESDTHEGKPLYQEIMQLAFEKGLAGCTVLKGFEGFGVHHKIHTAKILRLSENLPIVVEIIDTDEKIDSFLPQLDSFIQEGMVSVEKVDIFLYRRN